MKLWERPRFACGGIPATVHVQCHVYSVRMHCSHGGVLCVDYFLLCCPPLYRVSVPRSVLQASYKVRPHRRRSFDPTDSMGLAKVALKELCVCVHVALLLCVSTLSPCSIAWQDGRMPSHPLYLHSLKSTSSLPSNQ